MLILEKHVSNIVETFFEWIGGYCARIHISEIEAVTSFVFTSSQKKEVGGLLYMAVFLWRFFKVINYKSVAQNCFRILTDTRKRRNSFSVDIRTIFFCVWIQLRCLLTETYKRWTTNKVTHYICMPLRCSNFTTNNSRSVNTDICICMRQLCIPFRDGRHGDAIRERHKEINGPALFL